MTTKVAVVGASGRMGRLVVSVLEQDSRFELYAALGSQDSLNSLAGADLVVDVTLPDASPYVVDYALKQGITTVVGTSGWSAERIATVQKTLAEHPTVGLIIIPNFSLGSVLSSTCAAIVAPFFNSVEIIETHSSHKIDSPSGTAMRTAEMIAAARSDAEPIAAANSDHPARGYKVSGIPIHSVRLPAARAAQEVIFATEEETLTISHQASSLNSYRPGILLTLAAAPAVTGLRVGLESFIDIPGVIRR